MYDAVLDALSAALAAAGLNAGRQYPDTPAAGPYPAVRVGLKSGKLLSAGSGDYLGERDEGGAVRAVYGYRTEAVAALDLYAPEAADCLAGFNAVSAAVPAFPAGLRTRALICGETVFETETGLFHCPAELHFLAFLTRDEGGETGEFTDFVLRGVLK